MEGTNMTSVYLSSGLVNNKGVDQPVYSHSLISAFVVRSFESIIYRISVAKETGVLLCRKHRRQVYFASRPKFIISVLASILIPSSVFFCMF